MSESLQTDLKVALDFLEPHLKAARKVGGAIYQAFHVPDQKKMIQLLVTTREEVEANFHKYQDGRNCYFSPGIRDSKHPTPFQKSGVIASSAICFDQDFKDIEEAEARKLIENLGIKPSVQIMSGGGLQGGFIFDEPVIVKDPASFDSVIKKIAKNLKGDTGHVGGLYRVPGFVNYPNKKKRDRGRVPVIAQLEDMNAQRYTAEDFVSLSGPEDESKEEEVEHIESLTLNHGSDILPARFMSFIRENPNSKLAQLCRGEWEDKNNTRRSGHDAALACALILHHATDNEIAHAIGNNPYGKARERSDPQKYIRGVISNSRKYLKGKGLPKDRTLILSPKSPLKSAREYIAREHTRGSFRTLHYYRGDLYRYKDSTYKLFEKDAVFASLYSFLDFAMSVNDLILEPFDPNRNKVTEVYEALKAETLLDGAQDSPFWLSGKGTCNSMEIISMKNGIFYYPTHTQLPPTPDFFSTYALPYDFDPSPPLPAEWFKFLDSTWGDDRESIDTLQEIMGLALTGITRFQKISLLIGPKRSGKGTIARVIRELIGYENVAAPTLASFSTNFGLQPLLGKPLAIIGDARLDSRNGHSAVVERLLSISGEDAITVDRKHREPLTVKLTSRFIIISNELPRLLDQSGALTSRFIPLKFTKSFLGKEDPNLTDKLIAEIPSIFNWAIVGLNRLLKRGHFVQPSSAQKEIQTLEDLSSPIQAFLRDECAVSPMNEVKAKVLFEKWKEWRQENGIEGSRDIATFGRDLRSCLPSLNNVRRRRGEKRFLVYVGVKIRENIDEGELEFSLTGGTGIDLNRF